MILIVLMTLKMGYLLFIWMIFKSEKYLKKLAIEITVTATNVHTLHVVYASAELYSVIPEEILDWYWS